MTTQKFREPTTSSLSSFKSFLPDIAYLVTVAAVSFSARLWREQKLLPQRPHRGGARGGLGGLQPPSEASSPPSEEILDSRRRKFGKITHGNTIFQSFQPPCWKLQPLCRKISGATPVSATVGLARNFESRVHKWEDIRTQSHFKIQEIK